MNAQIVEPLIRNALRVASGYIIAKGGDPDFAAWLGSPEIVGFLAWGATELWYAIAKRKGWAV